MSLQWQVAWVRVESWACRLLPLRAGAIQQKITTAFLCSVLSLSGEHSDFAPPFGPAKWNNTINKTIPLTIKCLWHFPPGYFLSCIPPRLQRLHVFCCATEINPSGSIVHRALCSSTHGSQIRRPDVMSHTSNGCVNFWDILDQKCRPMRQKPNWWISKLRCKGMTVRQRQLQVMWKRKTSENIIKACQLKPPLRLNASQCIIRCHSALMQHGNLKPKTSSPLSSHAAIPFVFLSPLGSCHDPCKTWSNLVYHGGLPSTPGDADEREEHQDGRWKEDKPYAVPQILQRNELYSWLVTCTTTKGAECTAMSTARVQFPLKGFQRLLWQVVCCCDDSGRGALREKRCNFSNFTQKSLSFLDLNVWLVWLVWLGMTGMKIEMDVSFDVKSLSGGHGEALEAEAAGADAIVAQGMEAGGHRGAFQAENAKDLVGLFDSRRTKCC